MGEEAAMQTEGVAEDAMGKLCFERENQKGECFIASSICARTSGVVSFINTR